MLRALFRMLSIWRDAKAVSRGPGAYGKRLVRKAAYRQLGKALRKL